MPKWFSGLGEVADGTGLEGIIKSLKLDEFYPVVGFTGWCDGMGAIVAGGAVDFAVALGYPVKRLILGDVCTTAAITTGGFV